MPLIALLLTLLVFGGCSKGPLGPIIAQRDKTAGGDCEKFGAKANIISNHDHSLTIPANDVLISQAKSYDITGTAGHSHTIDVSVDGFNRLALRTPLSLTSSVSGAHSHNIVILCQ